MDHLTAALLIPVAVIVMGGLSQIARELSRGRRRPDMNSLEAQMESLEQELRSVRRDLSETQERLDFAERLLAQSRDRKLGASE
jgi:septal ring factor EnvC (AmiA/AmiB activator)